MTICGLPYGYDSLSANKVGYNSETLLWNEKAIDSITIFLLDTSGKDGVMPGMWKGKTKDSVEFSVLVDSAGKQLLNASFSFLAGINGALSLTGPFAIASDGTVKIGDSLTFYFSDSVVVGTASVIRKEERCASGGGSCSDECHYKGNWYICSHTCTCDAFSVYYVDRIFSTSFRGSTSSETGLSNLSVSTGTMAPSFSSAIKIYVCSLSVGVLSMTVTPTATDPNATIQVNGSNVVSGNPSNAISFATGLDSISIEVIATNQMVRSAYVIRINMPPQWFAAGLTGKGITKIVSDPDSFAVIWAFDSSTFFGGLKKSLDGGTTWVLSKGTPPGPGSQPIFAMSPSNPGVLIMSDNWNVFKTTNRGATWDTTGPFPQGVGVKAFCFDPINEAVVYSAKSPSAITKSINGGLTWTACSLAAMPAAHIAVAKDNSQIIYVVCPQKLAQNIGGIYKSIDGGVNWNRVLQDSTLGNLCLDPLNNEIAYVIVTGKGVMKTVDGGQTWNFVNSGLIDLNVNDIAINPKNGNAVFAGTAQSGVYRSIDGGTSWSPFNAGLTNLSVLSLVVADDSLSTVYAGTKNGVFKYK